MLPLPAPKPIIPRLSRSIFKCVLAPWLLFFSLLFLIYCVLTPYNKLMWAIASGNRSAVKAVLDSGTDPNGLPESQEDENVTPLAAAAADGKLEIVRLLLNRGADVNLSDCWEPPLAVAACEDRVEVVKLLIARGATVNDSERGSYALWRAAVEGKAASVRVLLAHGANPNSYNVDGSKKETLLQVVEGFHLPEVVAILRQAGAK